MALPLRDLPLGLHRVMAAHGGGDAKGGAIEQKHAPTAEQCAIGVALDTRCHLTLKRGGRDDVRVLYLSLIHI